jgi:hemerythrin-like metal-binding protein/PAS domain S-box-containing protein
MPTMRDFFKNLSIQAKLLTGFGIIVLIMMITGVREIMLLNNLDQKRENTSNAVSTSYMLKEGRFIINSELTLLNELYSAPDESTVDELMETHLLNRNSFAETYSSVERTTRFKEGFRFNDENKTIRDSLDEVREVYQSSIDPVFERMAQARKNLLNIDVYYREYLRVQMEDTARQQRTESKEALKITIRDEMNNSMDFVKEAAVGLINKIQHGEQISAYISQSLEEEMKLIYESKTNETFIFVFSALLISALISLFISRLIIKPVEKLRLQIEELTGGKLPEDIYTGGTDEIGQMGQALGRLVSGLRETVEFSIEIGKGNFAADYSPMSKDDVLGNSLLSMRDSLKTAKEEEEKRKKEDYQRNRAAEGLALFGDILRRYSDDISALSDEIISNLVKFTGTNQGAIFILNDEDKENIYLDLQGAYAYNRKKYLKKQIEPGVGLIGAVFLEKYTMYLTEVPNDFVEIESGLGGENPKSILIVPLKIEDEVLGVVELASFSEFESYEIELVERISESIASTLSTTRINARTARLLEQSKKQAVRMREQEEEMLQNIEELKATQEENEKQEQTLRKENAELKKKADSIRNEAEKNQTLIEETKAEKERIENQASFSLAFNDALLQKSPVGILVLDSKLEIRKFNHEAENIWAYPDTQVIGKNLKELLAEEYAQELTKAGRKRALNEFFDKREIFIRRKDGSEIPVICYPAEFKSRQETLYILQVRDLRAIKQQEEKTKNQLEKTLAADLEKTIRIERLEAILKRSNLSFAREAESVDLIHFDENLVLGIEVIDQQHKKWISQMNNFYAAIKERRDQVKIEEALRELIDYSDYHFSFEEKYMKEFDFIFYDKHIKHHEVFLNDLNAFKEVPTRQRYIEGIRLMRQLRKMVTAHIMEEDKKYIPLFKEKGLI